MGRNWQTKLELVVCGGSKEEMEEVFDTITKNNMWRKLDVASLILRAIQFNPDARVAKALLEHPGTDVNYRDRHAQTPLHTASLVAARDDRGVEFVELLLRRADINVNATAKFGVTPLHVAARFSCLRVLELLLEDERVKIDAQTDYGFTALHLVAQGGSQNSDVWNKEPSNQSRCEAMRMLKQAAERKQITPDIGCCLNQLDELQRYPLHYGVESDGLEIVAEFLKWKNVEINVVDIYGLAPLHIAARSKAKDRAQIVKLLLEVPTIDANIESSDAQLLIQRRSNINWMNQFLPSQLVAPPHESKRRALDFAVEEGHEEVVEILLECNLESWNLMINRKMSTENTLLQLATMNGWYKVLRLLLNHVTKSDLIGKNSHENTLLHLATENGHVDVMNLLLEHVKKSVLDTEDTHVEEVLLDMVNGKNLEKNTPLHLATKMGCVKVVEVLLGRAIELRLKIDEKNFEENTPLHLATKNGHVEVVEVLLNHATEKRLIINAKNSNGNTPLHLATQKGDMPIMKVLLSRANEVGLDIGATNSYGNTALHLATESGDVKAVNMLLGHVVAEVWLNTRTKNSEGNTPLHIAIKNGHMKVVEVLMRHTPEYLLMERNNKENTLLHLAANEGHLKVVELLWKRAPQLELDDENENGNTAFHLAVNEGHCDVVQAMLEHAIKLDVNRMNNIGNTPLHLATKEGHVDVMRVLLKHAIDSCLMMNEKNIDGNTPMHLATKDGNVEVVTVLMDHVGSMFDINSKNNHGETPLKLATKYRHLDVVKVLCDTKQRLLVNPEDVARTCIEYNKEQVDAKIKEIADMLNERDEVIHFLDRHYRDRQVFIDAANAILVGGALIAGITFAAWLQPPLGYAMYYQFPQSSPGTPPSTFELFAAVELHSSLRLFWVFNTLSFFFAIATVISGAKAASPNLDTIFIVDAMDSVRMELLWTSILLLLAVITVLGSFVCAGFAVLPPISRDMKIMAAPTGVGLLVCILTMYYFFNTLSKLVKAAKAAQVAKAVHRTAIEVAKDVQSTRDETWRGWLQHVSKSMQQKWVEIYHVPMNEEESEAPTRFFSTKICGQFLAISTNKLCVQYVGKGQNDNDVGVIQGNRCVPCKGQLYYFEIKVNNKGLEGSIAIGFTSEHSNNNRKGGWGINSYSYNGSGGHITFNGKGWRTKLPTFTTGDIVGVGISYVANAIFFTKNRKIVGPIFMNGITSLTTTLYPTVSLHSLDEEVEVNFGQRPLAYDLSQIEFDKHARIESHDKTVVEEDVSKWSIVSYPPRNRARWLMCR